MAGFNLDYGEYIPGHRSEDELWAALSYLFSSKSVKDTTYKYGFLKAILDNLYNVDENLMLTFDQLFGKFAEIYWNLVLKYNLRQKAQSKDNKTTLLEQVLYSAKEKYQIYEPIPYESLTAEMMLDIEHRVKVKCKNNVVGALYADTGKLFYSFDKKGEWIRINPVMYEFVCKHKVVIEKLNYYEWAKFLEKVNGDSDTIHLLTKIDESSKRNNLAVYRQILFDEFESKRCFYCGRELKPGKIHVDHFVPWSFIKDDNLWNMVLTCPQCNTRKNDKLPGKPYLEILVQRNDQLMVQEKRLEKWMSGYRAKKLEDVYDWAKFNGYDNLWSPSGAAR